MKANVIQNTRLQQQIHMNMQWNTAQISHTSHSHAKDKVAHTSKWEKSSSLCVTENSISNGAICKHVINELPDELM